MSSTLDLGAEWDRLMRSGDFEEACRISDLSLATRPARTRDDPTLPYHLRWVWDGRPFEGRHVLVRCYHGLGDTLQFARYLPVLRRSVASLSVEAQPELAGLLRSLGCVDRLLPFVLDAPALESECDLEMMELPFALRLAPERVAHPYLRSPRTVLAEGSVGLCWEAGRWDPDRSLPAEAFEPFTSGPCVTLLPNPTTLNVVNPQGCPLDMDATAAIVAGLDLVITVDTMIAHLAGALGRPTWLLLKHKADWRWMTDRTDSPWYPTMRLYRQTSPGDWASVMTAVTADWERFQIERLDKSSSVAPKGRSRRSDRSLWAPWRP